MLGDLWRRDEDGRRRLTLRQLHVYTVNLTPRSGMATAENGGQRVWDVADYLLADLWEQTANRGRKRGRQMKRHPARPVAKKVKTAEQQRRDDANLRRHRRKYQAYYGT
ncbi:hypothetical protein [Gordonia malaquae]|uniref:hypothetical protein n=1 Tax=Gordonia malaquae TaxID=410332 RepID=UPI00301B0D4A